MGSWACAPTLAASPLPTLESSEATIAPAMEATMTPVAESARALHLSTLSSLRRDWSLWVDCEIYIWKDTTNVNIHIQKHLVNAQYVLTASCHISELFPRTMMISNKCPRKL